MSRVTDITARAALILGVVAASSEVTRCFTVFRSGHNIRDLRRSAGQAANALSGTNERSAASVCISTVGPGYNEPGCSEILAITNENQRFDQICMGNNEILPIAI